jgi:hypothetical protein
LSAIADFGFPATTLTPDGIVAGHKVIEIGVVPVQIHRDGRVHRPTMRL